MSSCTRRKCGLCFPLICCRWYRFLRCLDSIGSCDLLWLDDYASRAMCRRNILVLCGWIILPCTMLPCLMSYACDSTCLRCWILVWKYPLCLSIHNILSWTLSTRLYFCKSVTSSISFRTLTLWRRLRFVHASATVSVLPMPSYMIPLGPIISNTQPRFDQQSYQKEVRAPFPTTNLQRGRAKLLSFNSFFHIQDPKLEVALIDQKESFW